MPLPYVTRAELKDGKIVLDVRVDDYGNDEDIEISGEATQDNEAFATFRDIQNTRDARTDDGYPYLTVTAEPVEADKFGKGYDDGLAVTVVARISRVWVTVLDKDGSDPRSKTWRAESPGVSVKALPRCPDK